jgi:drug/metabolite transporter (DMT)-like permease
LLKLSQLSLRQKGLLFAAVAPLLYALKSVVIKFAPQARVEVFVFLRFLFDFLLLSPFFLKHWKKLGSKQLSLHFIRAIFVTASVYCSVYGLKHLALVDAILLENTISLFIPLIVWVWYREKITLHSCFALILGFFSLFFILKPTFDMFHLASLASIATGFICALTAVSIKPLSKTDHPFAILFYFNLFSGLLSVVPSIPHWESTPFLSSWWIFVLISFFGVLFQYAITRAHSLIGSHIVGGFAYFSILFSALFGWLFWQETLSGIQVFGAGLLIGSGLLILHQNRKSSQEELVDSKSE